MTLPRISRFIAKCWPLLGMGLFAVAMFSVSIIAERRSHSDVEVLEIQDEPRTTDSGSATITTSMNKTEHQFAAAECKQKALCREYGKVRAECANLSGDLNACLSARMGHDDKDLLARFSCDAHGHIYRGLDVPEPSALECWINDLY